MENQEEKNILQKMIKPETSVGRVRQILVLITILVFGSLFISGGEYYNQGTDWLEEKTSLKLPKTQVIPFNLGLDLQGGTHLVYKADMSGIPGAQEESAIQGVRDVIERRVNVFGVSEPSIRTVKTDDGNYRIFADLAGISDVNEAIARIGETPLLQFKEMLSEAPEITKEQEAEIERHNTQAEESAEDILGRVLSGGNFEVLKQDHDESSVAEPYWATRANYPEIVQVVEQINPGEVYTDLIETPAGFRIVKLLETRTRTNEFTEEIAKEVKANHLLLCYEGAQGCDNGLSQEEARQKIEDLKNQANPDNFIDLVKEHSTEPGATQTGGDLGWFDRGAMVEPFEEVAFNQAVGTISEVVETQFGFHLIYKQAEREVKEYLVNHILFVTKSINDLIEGEPEWKNTDLTGKYLDNATVQGDGFGQPQVVLQFNREGADLFQDITERNVGNVVGIFLDGEVISAPTVNERIPGGRAVISGNFTPEEAKNLARRLNEGALPVPIELISQKTIGPTLGHESIDNSLRAGLIGLLLIAVYMLFIYRIPGLISVLSLLVYGVLVLALFKILSITLTLAGLAGFILSIGMAVDANVLILERLKEELRQGRDMGEALSEAFKRAWSSIRDGNLSTLITCFILMNFTTSLVRGFAITLGIGILVSLFASMVVTKNFMMLLPASWFNKKIIGIK